jgi:hypothetical protein
VSHVRERSSASPWRLYYRKNCAKATPLQREHADGDVDEIANRS